MQNLRASLVPRSAARRQRRNPNSPHRARNIRPSTSDIGQRKAVPRAHPHGRRRSAIARCFAAASGVLRYERHGEGGAIAASGLMAAGVMTCCWRDARARKCAPWPRRIPPGTRHHNRVCNATTHNCVSSSRLTLAYCPASCADSMRQYFIYSNSFLNNVAHCAAPFFWM